MTNVRGRGGDGAHGSERIEQRDEWQVAISVSSAPKKAAPSGVLPAAGAQPVATAAQQPEAPVTIVFDFRQSSHDG